MEVWMIIQILEGLALFNWVSGDYEGVSGVVAYVNDWCSSGPSPAAVDDADDYQGNCSTDDTDDEPHEVKRACDATPADTFCIHVSVVVQFGQE